MAVRRMDGKKAKPIGSANSLVSFSKLYDKLKSTENSKKVQILRLFRWLLWKFRSESLPIAECLSAPHLCDDSPSRLGKTPVASKAREFSCCR